MLKLLNVLLLSCLVYGHYVDDPYITITGETVRFGINDMLRNCAVEYEMSVEQLHSIFTIAVIDKFGAWMLCDCLFDVYTDVIGIPPSTYTASFISYDMAIWAIKSYLHTKWQN